MKISMARSKFVENTLKWCHDHPDDELSKYFLESYAEGNRIHREEAKRWKRIAEELEYYQYRVTRASVKSNQEERLSE